MGNIETAFNIIFLGEKDHLLAYDYQNNSFYCSKKGTKLPSHATTNLKSIISKVSECVENLKGVNPVFNQNEILSLTASIDRLKSRCDHYNAKIDNHLILRLVDRTLSFFGANAFRLKIETEPLMASANQIFDREVTKLLQNLQLEDLQIYATKSRGILDDSHYNMLFLANPLKKFTYLSYNAKNCLGEFIKTQRDIEIKSLLDWKSAPSALKVALLDHAVEHTCTENAYAIEEVIYGEALANYQNLSEREKEIFDPLIEYPANPQSKEGLFLLLHHIAHANMDVSNDKVIRIINSLMANTLKKDEIKQILKFLNTQSFETNLNYLMGISTENRQKLAEFFSTTNEKEPETFDHTALPLCCAMIDSDYEAFQQDEDLQELMASVLQKCKKSALNKEEYALLMQRKRLSDEFNKNPDRFLGTATEEQLETYYKQREKGLYSNKHHLDIHLVEESFIPQLPDGVKIEYFELQTMFDEINFNDRSRPDYVDPAKLFDDGNRTTVYSLKRGLESYIKNIQDHLPLYGAPSQERDPQGYNKFYANLELYLKHSILELRKRPKEDRAAYVLGFASLGLHCGTRYFIGTQDIYCQLTGNQFSIDKSSLKGGLLQILAKKRAMILKKIANDIDSNVHFHLAMIQVLGEELGIPDAKNYDFSDAFSVYGAALLYKSNARQKFYSEYSSTTIVNEIMKHLEGIAGHPKTIQRDFRETMEQWFQENMPEKYRQKAASDPEYNFLSDIYDYDPVLMIGSARIKREWIIYLLQEIEILERPADTWYGKFFQTLRHFSFLDNF
jgi:hypothetical protein